MASLGDLVVVVGAQISGFQDAVTQVGLYAEALRWVGLAETLQREYRVILTSRSFAMLRHINPSARGNTRSRSRASGEESEKGML
jgi:hypothetical protein